MDWREAMPDFAHALLVEGAVEEDPETGDEPSHLEVAEAILGQAERASGEPVPARTRAFAIGRAIELDEAAELSRARRARARGGSGAHTWREAVGESCAASMLAADPA